MFCSFRTFLVVTLRPCRLNTSLNIHLNTRLNTPDPGRLKL